MRYLLIAAIGTTILSIAGSLSAAELSPVEREAGFVSLFDGTTLNGWTGAIDGYEVVDGAIQCRPKSGGNLLTVKEYADFELRLEFRLPPGGNNGIGLRAPAQGHVATEGIEIQVLDNTAAKYRTLQAYQYHGSAYGLIPAKRGYLREVGAWNDQEIRYVGRELTVILNGETIVQGQMDEVLAQGTLDDKDHPGARRTQGHLGFLGHNDPVAFRNIRVREITPAR